MKLERQEGYAIILVKFNELQEGVNMGGGVPFNRPVIYLETLY